MDSKYIEHWLTIGGFSLTMAGAIEAVMTLAQRIGLPGSVSHWSSKPLMTGVFEFTSTVMLGVTCVGLGEIVRLLRKSGKALRFKHEHRLISMARTAFVAAPMMGACAGFFAGMKAWKLAMAEPSGFLAMGSVVVKSVVSFAATFAWTVGITLALAEIMFLLGTGDPCEQIKLRNPSIYGFGGAALWLKPMAYLYLVAPLFIIATLVRLISPLPSPVDRGLIGVIGIIGAIRVAGEGILLLGIVEILNILARTPVVNRKFEAD